MPKVFLDGSDLSLTLLPSTWGALLHHVDGRLLDTGRIVTDARFDGVDEPAFREPDRLGRVLDTMAVVEVDSGTPASLMDRCLTEAVSAIPPLSHAAVRVAAVFRRGELERANQGLLAIADGLASLISIVGAAGLAYQVDLRDVRCGDRAAATAVTELGGHLETLVEAQQAGTWPAVADVLQFEIEPSLRSLGPVLESLRSSQRAS